MRHVHPPPTIKQTELQVANIYGPLPLSLSGPKLCPIGRHVPEKPSLVIQ